MADLTDKIRDLVARLSGAQPEPPAPAGLTPETPAAGIARAPLGRGVGPDAGAPAVQRKPRPGSSVSATAMLCEASMEDFARLGVVVTIWSRTLQAEIHLAPDPLAVAELVAAGVPRGRVYLPAEMLELRNLLTLEPAQRAAAVRTLDAARAAFGPEIDLVGVVTRTDSTHGGIR